MGGGGGGEKVLGEEHQRSKNQFRDSISSEEKVGRGRGNSFTKEEKRVMIYEAIMFGFPSVKGGGEKGGQGSPKLHFVSKSKEERRKVKTASAFLGGKKKKKKKLRK